MAAPQDAQKSVISLLLSAPSDLHRAWKSPSEADWETELDHYSFSPAARAAALETMREHKPHIAEFMTVVARVQNKPWAGGEPHPERDTAKQMVIDARRQDGE